MTRRSWTACSTNGTRVSACEWLKDLHYLSNHGPGRLFLCRTLLELYEEGSQLCYAFLVGFIIYRV